MPDALVRYETTGDGASDCTHPTMSIGDCPLPSVAVAMRLSGSQRQPEIWALDYRANDRASRLDGFGRALCRDETMTEQQYETYDPAKHNRSTPQEVFGPVVKVDKLENGGVYLITLNRPHRLNSIGDGLSDALYDAFEEYRDDPNARCAVLTGAGRAFCAGADLINTAETREAEREGRESGNAPIISRRKNPVPLSEALGLWKPTIAAINGWAVAGGFMYAMQCDIRIMSEEAKVGIAETRWNMGGAGWMTPLTRQIGLGSALELTLWGDTQYDAERCHQLGWVQRVVPQELLLETALGYARRMLYLAPREVRNIKQALYRGYYMEPMMAQQFGAAIEQNLQGMNDSIEGPKAFSEKRLPKFTDT
ncbi:MAG: enoyl-CoA hydratase/isomerase family protein [Chloroflexi bacterium]|nr:enoyl-CoA hydratase/isomerase family protein [Chloroflexota bacterium]MYF23286.1 enoyl-CoA hydratase/isomerase family protein [Chloroflexota bacterium]